MALFFVLVGIAWALYPGGNRFDLQARYYSFFGNFLCDLFDYAAYNKSQNPGRLYAIAGTYSLAISLLVYWWLIPSLFVKAVRAEWIVRIFGSIAMLSSFFVAVPKYHDACIILAVPMGLVAFVTAVAALMKSGERALAWVGVVSLATCVVNYLSFVFQKFPTTLPGVQKAALISFLAWVIFGMLRIRSRS